MWTECVQQSVITINFDQQWTYHQHLRNVFLLIRSFTHQWGLFKLFAKHFKCCRTENILKNIPFHTFYSQFMMWRHQYSVWTQLAKFSIWTDLVNSQNHHPESPWLYCEKVIALPCCWQLCQVMFQLWIIIIISNKWSEQISAAPSNHWPYFDSLILK